MDAARRTRRLLEKRFPRAVLRAKASYAACAGFRRRRLFSEVRCYCMFVGYPRSGHSLVGSLLNAHRHIVLAHELDALGYLEAGFGKNQLFSLIVRKDATFARHGRSWSGYDYAVPGQWQGRFERLRVIGDKKGSASIARIRQDPTVLDNLRRTVEVPVKIIHVIRNPFDNIATMSNKGYGSVGSAVDAYFSMCEVVAETHQRVDDRDAIDVRYEGLIHDPKETLSGLCEFLGLGAPPDYLSDCARVIFPTPRRTRESVRWSPELVRVVEKKMATFSFLDGYSFTN
jgi:hypothetical protein